MLAVVAHQLGRHGLEFAAVKHIQKQRGQNIVTVVSQRDFGTAQFLGRAVQDAAPQTAAQRTGSFALVQYPLHRGISVLFHDFERHADGRQVFRQHVFGEAGLLLVKVHGHQFEIDRRRSLQLAQNIQQRVAVLAAGKADHDFVAVFNHLEIVDRIAHRVTQAFVQFIVF